MVPNFQKIINSLFLLDNVDIYITGSNAYLLSGELATLLSGRYVEIKVLPLSFAEFYGATDKDKDKTFQTFATMKYQGHTSMLYNKKNYTGCISLSFLC